MARIWVVDNAVYRRGLSITEQALSALGIPSASAEQCVAYAITQLAAHLKQGGSREALDDGQAAYNRWRSSGTPGEVHGLPQQARDQVQQEIDSATDQLIQNLIGPALEAMGGFTNLHSTKQYNRKLIIQMALALAVSKGG